MIREIQNNRGDDVHPLDRDEHNQMKKRLKAINLQVDELSILTARAEQRLNRAFNRFRKLRKQQVGKVRAMIALEKALGLKRRK